MFRVVHITCPTPKSHTNILVIFLFQATQDSPPENDNCTLIAFVNIEYRKILYAMHMYNSKPI